MCGYRTVVSPSTGTDYSVLIWLNVAYLEPGQTDGWSKGEPHSHPITWFHLCGGGGTQQRLGLCQGEKLCLHWRSSDLPTPIPPTASPPPAPSPMPFPVLQLLLHLLFSDPNDHRECPGVGNVTTPSSSLTHPHHQYVLTVKSRKLVWGLGLRNASIPCLTWSMPHVVFTWSKIHCNAAICFCCDSCNWEA